jgi:phosphoribosylformylglycinamidine synthase
MKAIVHIFLKDGVLDVQGKAVESALHGLGFVDAQDVRVGRSITFNLAGDDATAAKAKVETMCQRLLANPVIESYRVEIVA